MSSRILTTSWCTRLLWKNMSVTSGRYHLYVKPEECEFHQTTITFLGYVISQQGVEMDHTKVHAVTEWPNTTTIKELQWFLGFTNFYRHFIQNYSSVAGPLTSLLRGKPRRLSWSDQAQAAFSNLKDSFTHHLPYCATLTWISPSWWK
ncbi:hypothetical protein QTP70_005776 [Hemibagrus guttatus]|uniref:Reverse transcriptase/retrotransposon-derived protein RNase H-like domain-containing protein n=1 Tax=Hemibagrus guttatus TaxID=175788 RepID=A0AAE0UXB9_9TELE|nr:hypothetical protein QTP70_005776 [Hemibagrus guttatus]